jgi:hypothetical protein
MEFLVIYATLDFSGKGRLVAVGTSGRNPEDAVRKFLAKRENFDSPIEGTVLVVEGEETEEFDITAERHVEYKVTKLETGTS